MKVIVDEATPVSLRPAFRHWTLESSLPGLPTDQSIVKSAVLHIFWNPTVTMTLFNPLQFVSLAVLQVNATTFYNKTVIISESQIDFQEKIGQLGLLIHGHEIVETPSIPVGWSPEGKQIAKDAVGGQLVLDVDVEATVLILAPRPSPGKSWTHQEHGSFQTKLSWKIIGLPIQVQWWV